MNWLCKIFGHKNKKFARVEDMVGETDKDKIAEFKRKCTCKRCGCVAENFEEAVNKYGLFKSIKYAKKCELCNAEMNKNPFPIYKFDCESEEEKDRMLKEIYTCRKCGHFDEYVYEASRDYYQLIRSIHEERS